MTAMGDTVLTYRRMTPNPTTAPETTVPELPLLTQFDFHARLAATGGPALVMFTNSGCGNCRHLGRVLLEVRASGNDWTFFSVDAGHEAGLVNEFEVFHLPTLFLFNDGEFHCELQSEARPAAIRSAVLTALKQPAAEAP